MRIVPAIVVLLATAALSACGQPAEGPTAPKVYDVTNRVTPMCIDGVQYWRFFDGLAVRINPITGTPMPCPRSVVAQPKGFSEKPVFQ